MSASPPTVLRQRAALCDMLDALSDEQWHAETLCEGWDAGDIVAHLLVREREPIPAIGILFPPLSGLLDRRMAARKAQGRERMMAALRGGPPPWMRLPVVRDVQVGEDWIHAADVARGGAATADGPAIAPFDGTEDADVARQLWQAVGRFAPMTLRGVEVSGVVDLTDGTTHRTYRVGGPVARSASGAEPDLTVRGPVGELVLFATGRPRCEVTVEGDEALRESIEGASRSV
ncbi:maleylpyruvate isomerase family mycothiol-dependent enzyme [Euzebya rosea]|uniref:maleylpyruvate isomerase family mycothiol-dependent enzyme n=1 Tax=Euzebya rosea TaxID=2052804 RepID=UPI00130054B4|nr:maleylpyruvate isomerase family mycothiol-dependent enzyme [Euzebya rosea]